MSAVFQSPYVVPGRDCDGLLVPAIRARDLGEVKAIIAEACAALAAQPPVPISPELMRPAVGADAR